MIQTAKERLYKINEMFAFVFILFPAITFFVGIFFSDFIISYCYTIWVVLYLLFSIFFIPQCLLPKLKTKKKLNKTFKILFALASYLALIFVVTSLVRLRFNLYSLEWIGYFFVFICFSNINSKHIKKILNIFFIVLTVSSILCFIDPYNAFMPGFGIGFMPTSLFFINPNFAGYVFDLGIILCLQFFLKERNKFWKVFYFISIFLYNVYLGINGSIVSISLVLLLLVIELIYYWIKEKKCPYNILLLFFVAIASPILVELLPYIEEVRTCKYNYYIELVATFDEIFGTKLLNLFFGLDFVPGVKNGNGRLELLQEAFSIAVGKNGEGILNKILITIFGNGAGLSFDYRPHNIYLAIWIDYGLIATLCYLTILILLIVKCFKTKNCEQFGFLLLCGFIYSFFGSYVEVHFMLLIMSFALAYKLIKQNQ